MSLLAKNIRFVADLGHGFENRSPGSFDPGICSHGSREVDVALDWGETGKFILEGEFGIDVLLTRESNEASTPLTSRTRRAKDFGATHFLSIHANGSGNEAVRGSETICRSRGDVRGWNWASLVHKALKGAVKTRDRGVKAQGSILRYDPSIGRDGPLSLYVLNTFTANPAALVELGFLSNSSDRAQLLSKDARVAFWRGLGKALLR